MNLIAVRAIPPSQERREVITTTTTGGSEQECAFMLDVAINWLKDLIVIVTSSFANI